MAISMTHDFIITQEKAGKLISKPKMTDEDVAELVDITLAAKPIVELKAKMQLLITEGFNTTSNLSNRKMAKLRRLLSFMIEDL